MDKDFKTPLEGALFMAAKGLKVFPLRPALNDPDTAKTPLFSGFQDAATSDPFTIQQWAKKNKYGGFGVLGLGHCFIDDDSNTGAKGLEAIEAEFGPLPETLKVRTWSGGTHSYFVGETAITTKTAFPHIDSKSGRGGYVICPGTVFYGANYETILGRYTLEHDAPIALLPPLISARFMASGKREPVNLELNPIGEGSRNDTMIRLAGLVRSRGVDYEGILGLLNGVNETQTDTPLHEAELVSIASSALRYSPKEALDRLAFPEFCAAETHGHSAWGSDISLDSLKPTDWLIRGRYVPGYLTVTGAPAGVGKSRVVMLEAIAVATGRALCGHEIRQQGPVWYISEDPLPDMMERFAGVCQANNIDHSTVPLLLTSLMDLPLRLIQKEGGKYVIDEARAQWMEDKIAEGGIKLLILDPWKRFSNCEENDNSAADALCAVLQRIASRGKCAVGIVHHTGKAASKGDNIRGQMDAIRGASALAGAARVIWTIDHYRSKPDAAWEVPEDDERLWVRMDPAKCNLAPLRPSDTLWYHLTSVRMAHHVHPEDSVGVAVCETPKKADVVEDMSAKADSIRGAMVGPRMALKSLATKILESGTWKHFVEETDKQPNITTLSRKVEDAVKGLSGFDGFPYVFEVDKKSESYSVKWVTLEKKVADNEFN